MADSYIIFECLGGTEKDLIATAVVANLAHANKGKKIVVISLCPEIWLHNPNVFRVYKAGATPYFFNDYVEEKDTVMMRHDPYNDVSFTKQFSSQNKEHIIKIWSEMLGARFTQKTPELFFTGRELEVTKRILERGKPLFFIDTGLTLGNGVATWARNIPFDISQEIARRMIERGYHVFQIGDDQTPVIRGAEKMALSLRLTLASISHSNARFFTHSFLEHAAVGLKKPSAVMWVANNPEIFGYELHKNIKLDLPENMQKNIDSFCEFYVIPSPQTHLPQLPPESLNIDKIISGIMETSG